MLGNARKTLTYNDFYYTNMVVARDGSAAFMFDYNLLGKGMVVSDLRNVTYSLSPAAKDAFLAAYGPFDPLEEMLDDVVSPVVTLWLACQRQSFPNWAVDALQEVETALPAKSGVCWKWSDLCKIAPGLIHGRGLALFQKLFFVHSLNLSSKMWYNLDEKKTGWIKNNKVR